MDGLQWKHFIDDYDVIVVIKKWLLKVYSNSYEGAACCGSAAEKIYTKW
jgi:hypothetical protein